MPRSVPLPEVQTVDATPAGARVSPPNGGERTAVVIGNFDGVHRGHVAVLEQMSTLAKARDLIPSVLTFDPHPATVLGKAAPARLSTLERRVELFAKHGVERVYVARFSAAFAETPPYDFVKSFVTGGLGAKVVVVGADFRFGKSRGGDFDVLRAVAAEDGCDAFAAVLLADSEGPISSTRVRKALALGDVHLARDLLGRPHTFSGVVVHGAKKGRTIGFPTANLGDISEALPANGVYAVAVDRLSPEGARALANGVMNLGTRPTVSGDGTPRHAEVFLFDVDEDLYGQTLRVHVHDRIRDEKKFDSFDALKGQIASDTAAAKHLAATRPVPASGPFG